jgi:methylthioribose-1-phosphate isomerase
MYTPAIIFDVDKLTILDQTLLPHSVQYIDIKTFGDTITAIKELKIRGAPAIGIVAAYTMYITAKKLKLKSLSKFKNEMDRVGDTLLSTRPTAVNLSWAIKRIKAIYNSMGKTDVNEIINRIRQEAIKIHEEDKQACRMIGENGLSIISNPCNILTHCNTGSLATGGWGTALGIVYAAKEKNYNIHVYVDETRPLGQGARLTFWELMHNDIPCTLITDSMAGSIMRAGNVDLVLFGADRIAANGDVANKIGSYGIAALANLNKIPCYAVAPTSTIDISLPSGRDIPIEYRDAQEILHIYGYNDNLPGNAKVYNAAFDVTPAELLSGIITERAIILQPFKDKITKVVLQT